MYPLNQPVNRPQFPVNYHVKISNSCFVLLWKHRNRCLMVIIPMKHWLHCGTVAKIIKTFVLFQTTYHWVQLVQIPPTPAFQRWFLYELKVIDTFCRTETICGQVNFTMKVIKIFFFPGNLLSGSAFSCFSEVDLIWFESD